MGSAILFNAARMQEIEDSTVVAGFVDLSGHLLLQRRDGGTIDAGNVQAPNLADASDTVKGIVELATDAETITGTDISRAVTPHAFKAGLEDRTATTTRTGIVELATEAEAAAQTDTTRAVTPSGLAFLTQRGLDNRIINGDFRINQGGYVSGTALLPGTFTKRGHDRWLTPGVMNLYPNPRAGTTIAGSWSGANMTSSRLTGLTIPGLPGVTTAWRGTANAAGIGGPYTSGDVNTPTSAVPVTINQTYRVTVWLRSSVNKTIQPSIQWAGAATSNHGSPVNLLAGVWTRVTYTVVVPGGAVRMGPYWYSTTAWTIGQTIDATAVMITEGTADPDFFDAYSPGCVPVGTLDQSAAVNRPALTSYTFTQTPNGCVITLAAAAALYQVIERANMPAGDYTVSWSGSSACRVYMNSTLLLLASAGVNTGTLTFTTDGTDDIVIEFEAVGSSTTLGKVSVIAGAIVYPFRPRPIGEELALAQRYFYRIPAAHLQAINPYFAVALNNGGLETIHGNPPVPMRRPPDVRDVGGLNALNIFTMFWEYNNASGGVNQTVYHTQSSDRELLLGYSGSQNGGGTLASGRFRGSSVYPLDVIAEF